MSRERPQTQSVLDAPSLMARLTSFIPDTELAPPLAASTMRGSSGALPSESAGLEAVADAVQQSVQAVPMQIFEVTGDLPLLTPLKDNVTRLEDDREGFRQLQRELCLLVCILQRPKSVYTFWLGYPGLVDAMRSIKLVEQLVQGLDRMCNIASSCGGNGSSTVFSADSGSQDLDACAGLIRRYCEALLLYVFCHSAYTESAASGDSDAGAIASFMTALAVKHDEPEITASVATTLFRVCRQLGAETSRVHQGSALMLSCVLCVPSFQGALPFAELNEAAATAKSTPDAISHIPLIASVPYWVCARRIFPGVGPSESSQPADASTTAAALEWLRVAMDVCVNVSVYDADVSLLFRHDGTSASTFPLVKSIIGAVYEALWNCLSSHSWYLFSKTALWSAAKSMGIYAYVWGGIPRALVPLLSLLQFQLGQFARSAAKNAKSTGAVNEESLATSGPSASKALNSNFNALLSGAMGVSPYEPSAHSLLNSPDPDLSAAKKRDGADDDEDGEAGAAAARSQTDDYTMAFSFSTERAHTAYYLSVYAYAASALPFLCERFGDVRNALQWTVPTELYQRASQASGGSLPGRDDSQAATQDTLSRASGWLQSISDFSVDVDKDTALRTVDVHPYLTFPMQARFTEPGKVNLLSQTMELLCVVAQSGSTWNTVRTHSPNENLLYRLAESALALLHSLLSCYPQEVSVMSAFAATDLLSTLQVVTLWQLSLPFPTHHAQELTYSLLHRYFTVFPNLQTIASRLFKTEQLQAIGRQSGVVERIVLDQHLYTQLLTSDEEASGLFVHPIITTLCQVPEDMIATTMDGGHLFVSALSTLVCAIQQAPNVSLRRVFEEALVPVDVLVGRVCEGLLFLYKQWVGGNTYVDNHCTLQLLDLTLQVLTQTLFMTKTGFDELSTCVMASTPEPFTPASLVEPTTSAVYAIVRLLTRPELDCLGLVERAAECLCLCVSHVSTPLFGALHASCSRDATAAIAQELLAVTEAQEGTLENVYRLEALRVVQRHDWHLFHLLTGSESLQENKRANATHELAFFKRLKAMVSGKKASRLEQAAALSLMRDAGDEDSITLSRLGQLLERRSTNPLSNTFETVALAAACIEHMNTRTARGFADLLTTGAPSSPQHRSQRENSNSGGGDTTPSHRPASGSAARAGANLSSPSTPRRSFVKMDREQSDAMDKACRDGTVALEHGLDFLSKLMSDLFYDERVSLIGEAGALLAKGDEPQLNGRLNELTADMSTLAPQALSRAGGAAFSPIVSASTRSAIAAPLSRLAQDEMSLQLPSTTRLHQLSDALGNRSATASTRLGQHQSTLSRNKSAAGRNPFHTSVLPDPVADEEDLYLRAYPLALGTTYCYQNTEDDMHFNAVASVMDAMGRLAVALEQTVYLSSRDPDRNTLFLSRTLATLEIAVKCVLVVKPTMPLLNRSLWSYTASVLRLVLSLCRSVSTVHALDDSEISGTLRHALHQLGHFAYHNRRHVSIVNGCLEVAYSLPDTVFALHDTLHTFFATAQFALVNHVADTSLSPDVMALVHHVCTLLGTRLSSCPAPSLAILIDTVWKHAEQISYTVVATAASGPSVSVLVECVQCLKMCLTCSDQPGLFLTLLPRQSILNMTAALGQFNRADVFDTTQRVYCRQAWHTAWVALMELLHTIIVCSPTNETVDTAVAIADGWPLSIAETLTASPRFRQAVGAFQLSTRRGRPETDHDVDSQRRAAPAGDTAEASLLVWDVEETELSTRVVAALSAVGHHLPRLFPLVQNAFVSLHRFRILRYCTATATRPEVVAAESRRVEAAVARTVRDELRTLLHWPTKAIPASEDSYPALAFPCFQDYAAKGVAKGAVMHQRDVSRFQQRHGANGTGDGSTNMTDRAQLAHNDVRTLVDAVSLSMDVLRRFIVDELQLVRRLSSMDAGAGRGQSPDGPSTRPQSRESSVTGSPALGRLGTPGLHGASGVIGDSLLYDDAETVATDDDSGTLAADGAVALHVAIRSVHVECVQLALALFTAGATECLYSDAVVSGYFDSLTFQRDLLGSVNKLVDALDAVHKDIRKANSPILTMAVETMRSRLRTIKATLLS